MTKEAEKMTCPSCQSDFTVDKPLTESDNPEMAQCHECQALQAKKRGSGRDEGQSHLQYGRCERCGSQTQYFSEQHAGNHVICPACERHNSSSSY